MSQAALLERLTGEAHVWLLAVPERALSGATEDELKGILDPEERERAQTFRSLSDRQHFILAHAFLRKTLSRYAPRVAPAAWSYAIGPYGRPELAGPAAACGAGGGPRLRFNLSHTRGLVACSVTEGGECGVDVERRDRTRNFLGMARTAFAPSERAQLERLPAEQRQARFYQIWTLKEAYIKLIGMGLSQRLDHFDFDLSDLPAIKFTPPPSREPRGWRFVLDTPTPEHQLALAVDGALKRVVLFSAEARGEDLAGLHPLAERRLVI